MLPMVCYSFESVASTIIDGDARPVVGAER